MKISYFEKELDSANSEDKTNSVSGKLKNISWNSLYHKHDMRHKVVR